MKILIVDDESLIRFSLRSMIDEFDYGWHIVDEATNGSEMVEKVKQYQPDVVLVDIKMPKMNGLEGIKLGKKISPETKWIILTGFSEFHYAHEAIRLEASDYLVKPICPEELEKALLKMKQEMVVRQKVLNQEFKLAMINLCNNTQLANQNSLYDRHHFKGYILYFDSFLSEQQKGMWLDQLDQEITDYLNSNLENRVLMAQLILPTGEMAIIGSYDAQQGHTGRLNSDSSFEQIQAIILQQSQPEFTISIISLSEYSSCATMFQQLNQVRTLSALRTVLGIGRMIKLSDYIPYINQPQIFKLSHLLIRLADSYHEGVYLNFMKNVQHLKIMLTIQTLWQKEAVVKSLTDFLFTSIQCKLHVHESPKKWIDELNEHGQQLLKVQLQGEHTKLDLANQVIPYIEKNYMLDDMGMSQIAEELHVSPNYLSTLFHKKMGTTFMKYLTNFRILKAKELLANPSIKVKEVSEQVGYFSTRHFTKIFTEQVGCYPSEYRKKLIQ